MHKTIILDKYLGQYGPAKLLDFCYTHDLAMFICREACEILARRKSLTHHYVVTFSDEYSPGYRRIQLDASGKVKTRSNAFVLTRKQQFWLRSLSLKTLDNLVGHFYVKVTPFE